MPTVLITGVTGYVGSWCTHVALEAGYDVVGTVRDLQSSKTKFLRDATEGKSGKLSSKAAKHLCLVTADLLSGQDTWDEIFASRRIDYVMHTASPYFSKEPEDENDMIRPAVEGTESVLKASIKHGVKRFVYTSTVGTMWFPLISGKIYTESDWSNFEIKSAYGKSKTLAEQLAWELVKGSSTELVTIHPMFITGPTLYTDGSLINGFESGELVVKIMTKKMPVVPNIKMGLSDVRDVACAHLLALEKPNAFDHRIICSTKTYWFVEIIDMFAKAKPELKIPVKTLPSCFVWIFSLCMPPMRNMRKIVDKDYLLDTTALRQILELTLTPEQETVSDMVEDFIKIGAVPMPEAGAKR